MIFPGTGWWSTAAAEREMRYRLGCARDQQVPMTNYGILIAYVNGILKRSVEPFPEIYRLLESDIPQ